MNPAEVRSDGKSTAEPERGASAVPGTLRITLRKPTQDIQLGSSAEPTTLDEISTTPFPEYCTSPVADGIEAVECRMPDFQPQVQSTYNDPDVLTRDQDFEAASPTPDFLSSQESVEGSVVEDSEVANPSSLVNSGSDCERTMKRSPRANVLIVLFTLTL